MPLNHNLLGVATGVAIVVTGCAISFWFQRYVFAKYRKDVSNVTDKKTK